MSAFAIGSNPFSTHIIINTTLFLVLLFRFQFFWDESHIPQYCETVSNSQGNAINAVKDFFRLPPLSPSSPEYFSTVLEPIPFVIVTWALVHPPFESGHEQDWN